MKVPLLTRFENSKKIFSEKKLLYSLIPRSGFFISVIAEPNKTNNIINIKITSLLNIFITLFI